MTKYPATLLSIRVRGTEYRGWYRVHTDEVEILLRVGYRDGRKDARFPVGTSPAEIVRHAKRLLRQLVPSHQRIVRRA